MHEEILMKLGEVSEDTKGRGGSRCEDFWPFAPQPAC